MSLRLRALIVGQAVLLLTLAGTARAQPAAASTSQSAFWRALASHCGKAYHGRLLVRPTPDRNFRGDELMTVHFRECSADSLKVPFHVDDNRSRTWVFTWTADGLDLRHDHRHADGTPEANTMYGAFTLDSGTAMRQEFVRVSPSGVRSGWRVEIEPDVRYTYGTIRGDAWTYRIDFDLTKPVAVPPAPWGHGNGNRIHR